MCKAERYFYLLLIIFLAPILAQGKINNSPGSLSVLVGQSSATLTNFLNYYNPGNLKLYFNPEKNEYKPGDNIKFSGTISNNNDYPVADGELYIRIMRRWDVEEPAASDGVWGDFVDEFFAKEKINLSANSKKQYSFEWKIPNGLAAGRYGVYLYFVSNRSFYLAGTPINENSPGGTCVFNLNAGVEDENRLQIAKRITINGKEINVLDGLKQFKQGESVKIIATLSGGKTEQKDVRISKTLFFWDNFDKERQLSIKEGNISLPGNYGKISIEEEFKDLPAGSYFYKIVAFNKENKAILNARFAIAGANPPIRINFSGIDKYPLKKGEMAALFSVFSAVSSQNSAIGKVYVVLRDNENNVLGKVEYSGAITPRLVAFKNAFLPEKDYYDFWIDAGVFDSAGKIIEHHSVKYDCQSFNSQVASSSVFFKENVIHAVGYNVCGQPVKSRMYIEVREAKSQKVVFFESNIQAKEYTKALKLQANETYIAQAVIGTFKSETRYTTREEPKNIWFPILAAIGAAILIYVAAQILKKKNVSANQ